MLDFILQVLSNPAFWATIGGGLALNWVRAS